jgi:hypothetical protein
MGIDIYAHGTCTIIHAHMDHEANIRLDVLAYEMLHVPKVNTTPHMHFCQSSIMGMRWLGRKLASVHVCWATRVFLNIEPWANKRR